MRIFAGAPDRQHSTKVDEDSGSPAWNPEKSVIRGWGADVEIGNTALTGTATLTDDRHNHNVFLGVSDFYAVTVGTITKAKWRCRVVNTSNSSARCGINGGAKQRLYPGQHVDLFSDGTSVYMGEVPKRLKQNMEIYVDPVNGSDDVAVADGLDKCADGNYPELLQLNANPCGATVIFWEGASPLGAVFPGVVVTGDGAVHEMTNIKFAGGVQGHKFGVLDILDGCGIGALSALNNGISMDGAGATINVNASVTVFGAMNYLFDAPANGLINIAGNITITYGSAPAIGTLCSALRAA